MVQLNPVPVFGSKKKYQYHLTEFFSEISVHMVSAPKPSERWLRLQAQTGLILRNQSWIQNDPLFWLFHIVCTR